jgi:predicted GNAT family N-acyltransferase
MATEPDVRGSGAGRALVVEGLALVAARGGDVVWCDARVGAAGFYERMGFTVVTDEFEKTGIGPHVGMLIDVLPSTARRSS